MRTGKKDVLRDGKDVLWKEAVRWGKKKKTSGRSEPFADLQIIPKNMGALLRSTPLSELMHLQKMGGLFRQVLCDSVPNSTR